MRFVLSFAFEFIKAICVINEGRVNWRGRSRGRAPHGNLYIKTQFAPVMCRLARAPARQ